MSGPLASLSLSPVDSARTVARGYSLSLWILVLGCLLFVAFFLWARQRVYRSDLVARCGVVGVVAITMCGWFTSGQPLMLLPTSLSLPLVQLGRNDLSAFQGASGASSSLVAGVYIAGALLVLLRFLYAQVRVSRLVARSRSCDELSALARTLLPSASIRLLVSAEIGAPFVSGFFRRAILFPEAALQWSPAERRAALLHEVAHVRSGDLWFIAISLVTRALFWFHPVVWWISRRFDQAIEMRADREVLATGVRASTYARLLLRAGRISPLGASASLAARSPFAQRLGAILSAPSQADRPLSRLTTIGSLLATAALFLVIAGRELAPSESVLRAMMHDSAWESRAVAATFFAQRPDTLSLARDAALRDPSEHVRTVAARAVAASTLPTS